MRRLLLAALIVLSGCATAPDPQPQPVTPTTPVQQPRSGLIGMTAGELVRMFGNPALQVREGAGLKLQFRGRSCVLDAYLYAPAPGTPERVTHVDARLASGADTDQRVCIDALDAAA